MTEARARMSLLQHCPSLPVVALLVFPAPLSAQAAPSLEPAPWLVADSVARTATIALEVTAPAGSPSAVINGYREGGVQVVVPLRWTVTWDWRSVDSARKHSLVVMAEREKLPTEGGRPAFTNAMSRSLADGLSAGQQDRTTFEADQPGWYWLLCGVPGHALAGEWIGLRVDPEAVTAGVKRKPVSP
jgi:Sulfocyanin (SoxE) domain